MDYTYTLTSVITYHNATTHAWLKPCCPTRRQPDCVGPGPQDQKRAKSDEVDRVTGSGQQLVPPNNCDYKKVSITIIIIIIIIYMILLLYVLFWLFAIW